MNNKELDCIRDVAQCINGTAPLESSVLIRIVDRFKPNSKPPGIHQPGSKSIYRKPRLFANFRKFSSKLSAKLRAVPARVFRQGISRQELSLLTETASKLENEYPREAFKLYSIARSHGAGHLNEAIERLRTQCFGYMISARKDGTTERVNSILTGYLLAQNLDLPFRFSWATDVGAAQNELCSVTNQLADFIHPDFASRYFTKFDEVRAFEVPGYKSDDFFFAAQRIHNPVSKGALDEVLRSRLNVCPPARLEQPLIEAWEGDIQNAIRKIFRPSYTELLESFKPKVGHFVGIHYRGGDVIYGQHRHAGHSIGYKSAPLPVIEDLIKRNERQAILLFGTPIGETLDDLHYLRDKYENVTLSLEYADPAMDGVIQDSFLRSCCSTLHAYRGTGVARLAGFINTRLNTVSFTDTYSPENIYQIYVDNLDNRAYNDLQRSFININALALAITLRKPRKKRSQYLENIRQLDPDNKLHWMKTTRRPAEDYGMEYLLQ